YWEKKSRLSAKRVTKCVPHASVFQNERTFSRPPARPFAFASSTTLTLPRSMTFMVAARDGKTPPAGDDAGVIHSAQRKGDRDRRAAVAIQRTRDLAPFATRLNTPRSVSGLR